MTKQESLGPDDRLARHMAERRGLSMNGLADSALQGVTVSFLSQVFRMDPAAVKRRLVNCPILESRVRGTTQVQHRYDLATAAKYLIDPEIDLAEIIAKARKEDLPPSINGAYWDARLKRQKFEENAGDLWRTERVWQVLSDTFQTMKFTMNLWAETVERATGITEEQRNKILDLKDSLQEELYQALVAAAKTGKTGNQMSELPREMLELEHMDDDELDDEAAALI